MSVLSKARSVRDLMEHQESRPANTLRTIWLEKFRHPRYYQNYTDNTGPLILRPKTSDFGMLIEQIKYGRYKLPKWYLEKVVGKQVSVLDLGANIGTSSLFFLNQLSENGSPPIIVGLEPDLQNYSTYYTNVVMPNTNRWPYITPVHAAVGAKDGKCIIKRPQGEKATCSFQTTNCEFGDVPVLSMHTIIQQYFSGNVPNILKMDIEGAEFDLLDGACPYLNEVDILFLETHERFGFTNCQLHAMYKAITSSGLEPDTSYGVPGFDQDLMFVNQRLLN